MKALLGIFAVLLYLLYTTASPVIVKRYATLLPTLQELNEERREFAHQTKISNMNELVWDESLAGKANAMSEDCKEWKHGSDYRFMPVGPKEYALGSSEAQKLQEERKLIFAQDEKLVKAYVLYVENVINMHGNLPKVTLFFLEYHMPTQTRVGCAVRSCEADQKGQIIPAVCLFGPSNTIKFADVKWGEPGSACSTGKNDRGLCKMEVKSNSKSTITIINVFLTLIFVYFM